MDDERLTFSIETPLRANAFEKSDSEKIYAIESHFRSIMEELGLDLTDDSLKGTPYRVAKMYVSELFNGLNPSNKPHISIFENKYNYEKVLVEKNITLNSSCEHHFLPITGQVHVGYIPNKHIIGLSKINRLVKYFAKRPQVQERLTRQIAEELKSLLQTEHVIVLIEAVHLCVSSRGIEDVNSSTISLEYSGKFSETTYRNEFNRLIFSR